MDESTKLYTVPQVADQLGYSTRQVHRWIAVGRLRAVRVAEGSPWRVRHQDLAKFLANLETNEPAYRPIPRQRRPGGIRAV